MTALPLILMSLLGAATPFDGMVLDFSASWCVPCQQMSPIVSKLERQGYPIHKVDVEQQRDLAQQYQVTRMPTFVLIVRGKVVARIESITSEETLLEMLARIPRREVKVVQTVPRPRGAVVRGKRADEPALSERVVPAGPLAASTRIRIRDSKGENFGSGTIIDSRIGNTIVLTCAHIFRNLDASSVIEVDVFTSSQPDAQPEIYVGKLLKHDPQADVGLIAINTDRVLPTCRVASRNFKVQKNDAVQSIGCGGGENPRPYDIHVTALNRYLGPDNLECTGTPVQGRSGGGLFASTGEVIGVCSAADHESHRGLYCGLKPIQDLLVRCQLGHAFLSPQELDRATKAGESTPHGVETLNIDLSGLDEATAANLPTPTEDLPQNAGHAPLGRSRTALASTSETAEASAERPLVATGAEPAEVVCVIRSIENPQAASRVVHIKRASTKFVNYLTNELNSQAAVKATNLSIPAAQPRPILESVAANDAHAPPPASTRGYRRSRLLSW